MWRGEGGGGAVVLGRSADHLGTGGVGGGEGGGVW